MNPPPTNRSIFGLIWLFRNLKIPVLLPNTPSALLELGDYDKRILEFDNVSLIKKLPRELPKNHIRIPSKLFSSKEKNDLFEINFRYYEPNQNSRLSVFVPFGIHPEARIRGLEREVATKTCKDRIRIFCAGNLSYPEYSRDTIPNHFSLLNRKTAISAITATFPFSTSFRASDIKLSEFNQPICMVDQAKDGLDMESYFTVLESSTFVFCPPGVNHPHCHNVYEGMSRGCIPILEYPHLFHPKLSPGVNCLAFRGETELVSIIQSALALEDEKISFLRKNAMEFYNRNCNASYLHRCLEEDKATQITILNETASIPPTRSA